VSDLPSGGTVRPIRRWGEPVMHAPCEPVTAFDDELRELVADLAATMYAADGVGLAANQIGISLKVFVFDCPDDEQVRQAGVVCNPVLTVPAGRDRNLVESDEGCLSLPGAFVESARPDAATVTGTDQFGEPVAFDGRGLLARCLQHESDHLEGVVFGDRLPTRARKRLFKEADRFADEFPPGWPTLP
jgi:peptide deformylase